MESIPSILSCTPFKLLSSLPFNLKPLHFLLTSDLLMFDPNWDETGWSIGPKNSLQFYYFTFGILFPFPHQVKISIKKLSWVFVAILYSFTFHHWLLHQCCSLSLCRVKARKGFLPDSLQDLIIVNCVNRKRVRSFGIIQIWISDPRSLGSFRVVIKSRGPGIFPGY